MNKYVFLLVLMITSVCLAQNATEVLYKSMFNFCAKNMIMKLNDMPKFKVLNVKAKNKLLVEIVPYCEEETFKFIYSECYGLQALPKNECDVIFPQKPTKLGEQPIEDSK